MTLSEGELKFTFDEKGEVIKFDEDKFYRKYFMKLPEAKGVDFIYNDNENLIFLEVKDCYGYEKENLYRIGPSKEGELSFDEEVAKKVESTIACLVGSYTRKSNCEVAKQLSELYEKFNLLDICKEKKKLFVILLLEGNFKIKARTKKMIMKDIQNKLKTNLKWLECKVSVIDIETSKDKFFVVEREKIEVVS